jgi:hypothetical protein
MRLNPAILLLLGLSVALAGCERIQGTLGIGKISPNPLRVIRQDPLAVPPNLELRPPLTVAQAALEPGETLTSQEAVEAPASRGEAAVLEAAAAHDVDPEIRQLLERDQALKAAEEKESGGLLGFLDIFDWFGDDDDVGAVQPVAEAAAEEAAPGAEPAVEEVPPGVEETETGGESEGGGLLEWLDIFDWFGGDDDE